MKTLGYVVVLLLAFAVPLRAAQVYSGCAVPSATSRHVWYVDPVTRQDPGRRAATVPRPVHGTAFPACISGAWGAPNFSIPGYTRPLLSSVPYVHIANGQFVAVADQLGNPPVQPGDAIMLMSGNYGDIGIGDFDLPTTNSDFVTVRGRAGPDPRVLDPVLDRTNKWVFNAIKVQSLVGTNGNTHALITLDRPRPIVSDHRHHPGEHADQLGRQHGWLEQGAVDRAGPQYWFHGWRVWPAMARTASPTRAASRWLDHTSRTCGPARSSPPTTRCSPTT